MNTNVNNILPMSVRNCNVLSTVQMYFEFINRRHFENVLTDPSIQSAEDYLAEIQHYTDMCSRYEHLQPSLDIAQRYLAVATMLVNQMKGEI